MQKGSKGNEEVENGASVAPRNRLPSVLGMTRRHYLGALEDLKEVDGVFVREIDVALEAVLNEDVALNADNIRLDVVVLLGANGERRQFLVHPPPTHAVEDVDHFSRPPVLLFELCGQEDARRSCPHRVEFVETPLTIKSLEEYMRARHARVGPIVGEARFFF